MKKVIIILLAVLLAGCKTKEMAVDRTDTLYINKVQSDSFYQTRIEFDSIFFRDSIFVYANDSIRVKEVWKFRDRTSVKHDTVYKDRFYTDTIYRTKKDYQVVKEELTKWQKIKLDCGEFFLVMAVVLLVAMILPLFDKD